MFCKYPRIRLNAGQARRPVIKILYNFSSLPEGSQKTIQARFEELGYDLNEIHPVAIAAVFEECSIHSIDMDSYHRGIDLMLNTEFEDTGKHKENILGLETDIERSNESKFESYKEAVEGTNLRVWGGGY